MPVPTGPRLSVTHDRQGDTHLILLSGELDLATVAIAEGEVRGVREAGARRVVIDLSGLAFMDSTGLRLMLALDAESRADGFTLELRRGSEEVQRIFRLTGVEGRLPFAE